jgi:hypothetical protein
VPKFTEAIRKADMHFITATEMWDRDRKKDWMVSPDSSLGQEIKKTHPGIKIEQARTHPYPFQSYIAVNWVRDAEIKEAVRETKKAKLFRPLLKGSPEKRVFVNTVNHV